MKQFELKKIAQKCADKLSNSIKGINSFDKPFKHIVIYHFFPENFVNKIYENFPNLKSGEWDITNDSDIEIKQRSNWKSEFDIPDELLPAIRIFNSAIFLQAMSSAIGIEKLIPDPYFSGGGLNVTVSGGLLDVHVDGNYHDATGLNRRVNVILYLNPGWEKGWGGEFGLYDETGDKMIKKVDPLFNRLVIFDNHDKSFHGLPDPLNFPKLKNRKSIILYYYTLDSRPSAHIDVDKPHSALWKKRGGLDKRGNLTLDFS